MDFRDALLERHRASFGRDVAGWQIEGVDHDGPGRSNVRFLLPASDGRAAQTAVALIHYDAVSEHTVDRVEGPFGAWCFKTSHAPSEARSAAGVADRAGLGSNSEPWHETWLDTVQALLEMDFEPHDAVCLARAWTPGDTRWPIQLARFPTVTLESTPLPSAGHFPLCPEHLGLYVVVPTAEWIERLVALGVPTLQLRLKSDDPEQVSEQVARAERAARHSTSRLFINDDWQVAVRYHRDALAAHGASGIYGVHLGQEDLADADIAAIGQAGLRLGVSTHGFAEMLRVLPLRPSYLALGAVFPTTTKTLKTAPQGLARLQAYVELIRSSAHVDFPLVAIGGIDAGNAEEVLRTGVGNIAVVRAVTEARDVAMAVHRLRELAG
jgi:thiamine-phosphate pyrophosphorylase